MENDKTASDSKTFARYCVIAAAILIAAVALSGFIYAVGSGLLVLFICVLFGIIFDAVARFIHKYTSIGHKWALAMTVVLLLAALVLGLRSGGVGLLDKMPDLTAQLNRSINEVNQRMAGISWIRNAVGGNDKPATAMIAMATHAVGNISDVASLTLGALADVFVVFVVGIYFAWSPEVYARAFTSLFPIVRRPRIMEVLLATATGLRGWILGQLAAMVMVFLFITSGLLILGIDMALLLGAIAGLLTFVPYLGGLIASVPAILIAFLVSPLQAAWVALLFFGAYMLEGYFFTPMIQRRVISIAPAFLLIAQLMAASFSGLAGIFVAAPLAVALTVIIQMLYLQDVLGDTPKVLGNHDKPKDDQTSEPPQQTGKPSDSAMADE